MTLVYFKIIFILFFILILVLNTNGQIINKPILRFKKDKTFKIVQFTDLHYGTSSQKDDDTVEMQENVLEIEKPDFVMFSGDMISGYLPIFSLDLSVYDYYWGKFTAPLIKRNIPWAITMGNHDAQGPLVSSDLVVKDQQFQLSLSQLGPNGIHGASNYYLNVFSSDYNETTSENPLSERDKYISSLIYIFDSDTKQCNKLDWGCIHEDQVDWFKNVSKSNNRKNSVSFIHVPPIEVIDLWNHHDEVYGSFDEKSCCFNNKKSRFVKALLENKDVKGLYFGHDHKNDFHGDYHGMDMGYGRKSGAGSYSSEKPLGARVIELTENPFTLNTWIRETNGNKIIQNKPHKKHHYSYRCSLKNRYSTSEIILIILFSATSFIVFFSIIILSFFIFKKFKKGNDKKLSKSNDNTFNNNNNKVTSQ
ncbi:hypothetical protein ACTFIZ_001182 [Dictyostelium cf. discoideum]